jgi:hypothetical protein
MKITRLTNAAADAGPGSTEASAPTNTASRIPIPPGIGTAKNPTSQAAAVANTTSGQLTAIPSARRTDHVAVPTLSQTGA